MAILCPNPYTYIVNRLKQNLMPMHEKWQQFLIHISFSTESTQMTRSFHPDAYLPGTDLPLGGFPS